ncbi:MAG: radical SAM protein, partial [Pseudomonadota bacterium]
MHHQSKPSIALYIHWPFCQSKCPYCDFNSHIRAKINQNRWRKAMLIELEQARAQSHHTHLSSIFFGGGTPSLCPPETIAEILEHVFKLWSVRSNIEITLEANPSSSDAARFDAFCKAGINRISLGVQSFNDDVLIFLGRQHQRKDAIKAIEVAQ